MKKEVLVSIVIGSDSDLPAMEGAGKILDEFGVGYEYKITSAHRSPDRTHAYTKELAGRGVQVVIAGAGYSAHLAGVMASYTILPVIGVPLDASPLKGVDALYSTGQMPSGIPVATMTIGEAGVKNAALFALAVLALRDERLAKRLREYREKLADGVEEKDRNLGRP